MKPYTILVTGCGGDISQSIGKILRDHPLTRRVIGCDIQNDHAGQFIFHECFLVEKASSPDYFKSLSDLVSQQKVDIVILTTEAELHYFLIHGVSIENCTFVMPNNLAIEIGQDKLTTAKFLEENGFPFPKTKLIEDSNPPFLPCIIKPRRGSGSKALHIVHDKETYSLLSKLLKDVICQEYLDAANDEFTCAVFRSKSGVIRILIFRRKLSGGYSSFGVVEKDQVIENLLLRLASRLDLRGSINVQLRLSKGVPTIFEINSRFSSTVLFRHLLGFEDLIWAIEDKLDLPLRDYVEPPVGSKFYKGFQEYVVKSELAK